MSLKYIFFFLTFIMLAFTGCSTGIEKTKTISLTKNDRKTLAPTPEEEFIKALRAPMLNEWQRGKRFLISDDRVAVVFDAFDTGSNGEKLEGKVVAFEGVATKTTPDGSDEAVLVFSDNGQLYRFSTGRTLEAAETKISSMDVPMLIDLDLVDKAAQLMDGMKVWTRSQLWYDLEGNKIRGRKFVPVTIEKVLPGSMVFPLRLEIKDEFGKEAVLFMNLRNSGVESRTFPSLFNLSDQKNNYPSILPEVWSLIQEGKVRIGMTKEECKLSLGNPSDVNAGHDWNSTIDLWQYPNGSFLRFQDGLLVDFRN